MVDIKFFHPTDSANFTATRYRSKPAELAILLSESDLKRLMRFGQRNQVVAVRGGAFRWKGPFRLITKGVARKRKPTKPKPAPPIPRTGLHVRTTSRVTHKVKAKRKRTGKLSAYNLFVQKHRLAGKSMEQIGAMWRKKKK